MSGTDDLTTWLRAQLDEDERVAREADEPTALPWRYKPGYEPRHGGKIQDAQGCTVVHQEDGTPNKDTAAHIARWDPARVLAEVEAKRRILDLTGFDAQFPDAAGGYDSACEDVIHLLAQPYAGREGWREEWRDQP